jgi:hypothetical protein
VQQVLGLVLEAQDRDLRADLAIGERDAGGALADVDRMAVRAGLGVADGLSDVGLEARRHRVLQPLGLLVHVVPRDADDVGQEALDQAVAAGDLLRLATPLLREGDRAVAGARDVAVALEPAEHLVHRRGRQLHGAREVGTRHREPGLVEPEQHLEVLLLRHGHVLVRHLADRIRSRGVSSAACSPARFPSARSARSCSCSPC